VRDFAKVLATDTGLAADVALSVAQTHIYKVTPIAPATAEAFDPEFNGAIGAGEPAAAHASP
jgi:hypothetical protein